MTTTDYDEWQSCEHDDEPRDQQRDLAGGYWAEVGPDTRVKDGGWSWTVLYGSEGDAVADGLADDEPAAKQAVQDWAAANNMAGDALKPGDPIPPERTGGMTGFVVGECTHRVAASEWRAGFRNCERCGG